MVLDAMVEADWANLIFFNSLILIILSYSVCFRVSVLLGLTWAYKPYELVFKLRLLLLKGCLGEYQVRNDTAALVWDFYC